MEKTDESVKTNLKLEQKLISIQSRIAERKAERHFTTAPEPIKKNHSINFSTTSETKNDIEALSRLGRFDAQTLQPSNEHPTLLTRIPIFLPVTRSNQNKLLDEDNSLTFNTPWGQGRKFGPPLSVYDEDTIMAIGKLRQFRIKGHSHHFPIPSMSVMNNLNESKVSVHAICCMLSDIQAMCGTKVGGNSNKLRLKSLRRLGGTVLELTAKSKERYSKFGTSVKLIDIAWEEHEKNSLLYIQFSPLMSNWYDNEYTYIDWGTRMQLTDTGKSIHRFLSSQPKTYEIGCVKLSQTLMYSRPLNKFMADLRATLNHLIELRWLTDYKIEGTGRKVPFKLKIKR